MNLKKWGYTWDGMKEITREQAKKQYKEKETFILYSDDTESLIESEEQFNIKGVRYGVEKEERRWK